MEVVEKDDEILIRISKPISSEQYSRIKKYLEFMEIVSNSEATESDIVEIIEDVKTDRRARILQEIATR